MISVTEPTIKLYNKKIQDGAATIQSTPRNKKQKNGQEILLQNLTLQYSSKLHDMSNHKVLRLHEMLK